MGSKSPNKGLHVVVRIAELMRDEDVAWHIYGIDLDRATPYVQQCLDRIGAACLGPRFHWAGRVPDPRAAYCEVDAVLIASGKESFSRVAVEAMASGLPVVAPRIPGVSEVVSDGTSGLLFDPEQPAEAARHLLRMASDLGLRDELGAAGVRAAARFDIQAVGEALESAYREIFENTGGVGPVQAADAIDASRRTEVKSPAGRDSPTLLWRFGQRVARERMRTGRYRLIAASRRERPRPTRPIFIVGCPRSGTTLLFGLLQRHELLGSLSTEGHVLWNAYQHPRLKAWSSDRAEASDLAQGERRYLHSAIEEISGDGRFLDKTPRNVMRLPLLASLFPDACFVFVKRRGPEVVNSLIEGWTRGRGISYRLPQRLDLAEYKGRLWSYILVPGWRELSRTSLPVVAANQFVASNDIALSDSQRLPPSVTWTEVGFEELLDDPLRIVPDLLEELQLPPSESVMKMAGELAGHEVGVITPPRPGKWRDRAEAILPLLPLIEPTMARLGYVTENVS